MGFESIFKKFLMLPIVYIVVFLFVLLVGPVIGIAELLGPFFFNYLLANFKPPKFCSLHSNSRLFSQ